MSDVFEGRALHEHVEGLQRDGFTVLRGAWSAEAVRAALADFDELMRLGYGDAYEAQTREQMVPTLRFQSPTLWGALEDPRFADLAAAFFGEDVIGARTLVTRFCAETAWHSDTLANGVHGLKFILYLDPVGANSGALRMLPGSHVAELDETRGRDVYDRGEAVESFVCETRPGDAIALDFRVWHASFHGGPLRRAVQLVYFRNPETPEETAAARMLAALDPEQRKKYDIGHLDPMRDERPEDPTLSPLRRRWLTRAAELGWIPPARER